MVQEDNKGNTLSWTLLEASWNVIAHARKPEFVYGRNGRVYLNRRGASIQSTTGSRSVRISGSNAGYTMFWGSVKSTGYTLHSPVSPSLPPLVRHRVPSHFNWSLRVCLEMTKSTASGRWGGWIVVTLASNCSGINTSFFYALHLNTCISSPAPSRNVQTTVKFAGASTIVGPQYGTCLCHSSGAKHLEVVPVFFFFFFFIEHIFKQT